MMDVAVAVIAALAQARKATQLYPPSHPSFAQSVGALVDSVRTATAPGPLTLNVYQGRLYHESIVLPDDVPGMRAMTESLESRRIESISLHPGFGQTDALGLTEVLGLKPGPALDVEQELAARGVSNVSLAFLSDDDEEERAERDRVRQEDRALYNRLLATLRSLSSQMASGGPGDVTVATEVVGTIAQRLGEDQAAILGLATIRTGGEAQLLHSTNVMIYAVTLGVALGLPEEGLTSIGLSALLHDIGKAAFDTTDPAQAQAVKVLHPSVGAQILARLPEEDKTSMLVAYEHHMAPDGSGYPERPADYVPHPYSRMVAIADRFENLTKPDAYGVALTPDRGVAQLLREAGTTLDPLFARLFVQALGVFPVGCLVRLSDKRVGVVAGAGTDVLAPKVRVLYDSRGLDLAEPETVLLDEAGLTIVEVIDPDDLAVEVSERL
jgi:HD-GYP domain-containing protein (c-di-GMP phosphodiesterase class II)